MKKFTKKIFTKFAIGLLIVASLITSANAKAIDEVIPSINFYFSVNPLNLNDTLQGYYGDLMEEFGSAVFSTWEGDQEQVDALANYLGEISSKNKLYLLMQITSQDGWPSEEIIAIAVPISESDFNENINTEYVKANSTITEGANASIYTGEYIDGAMAYYEGYLFVGDTEESLNAIIESTEQRLSENSQFSQIKDKFLKNNFGEMYLSEIDTFLDIASTLSMGETDSSLTQVLQALGISISEEDNGFKFQTYITLDSDKVTELGYDFNSTGELSLYKYMPKADPIYFSDTLDSSTALTMLQSSSDYTQFINDMNKETGLNFEDLILLLDNEMAVLIDGGEGLIPEFTVMAELGSNKTPINTQVDKLVEMLWKKLSAPIQDEDVTLTSKKSEVEIAGKTLTEITLVLSYKQKENPYALNINKDLLTVKLTIGVTGDDVLLISTNQNIVSEYGQDLSNQSNINSLLQDGITEVSYLSISKLNEYLQNTLDLLSSNIPAEFNDISSTKEVLDLFLEPWSYISSSETTTNDYIEAEADIIVDFDKIMENYTSSSIYNAMSHENQSFNLVLDNADDFEDIHTTDWYGDNVYYLNTKGVIAGYPDGTYKPGNLINRAEFITLVIKTLEDKGYLYSNYWYGETTFTDVDQEGWYYPYVFTASEYGIMDGYDDKTFRPDQPVTRAEAAQVLSNIVDIYDIKAENQNLLIPVFDDVDQNGWYVNAINNVYINNLMTGTSQSEFKPLKELNRAESATIIRNLLEIL